MDLVFKAGFFAPEILVSRLMTVGDGDEKRIHATLDGTLKPGIDEGE